MSRGALLVQPPLRLSRDFIDYPYHCDLAVVQNAAVLRAAGWRVGVVDAFALPGSGLRALQGDQVLLGAEPPEVLAAAAAADEATGATGATGADVVVVHLTPFHRPPRRDPGLAELLAGLRAAAPRRPILLADLYQSGQHTLEADGDAVLAAYPEADAYLKYEAEGRLDACCQGLVDGGRPDPRWHRAGHELEPLAPPLPAWDLVDLRRRDAFCAAVVEALGRAPWAFPIDGRTLPALSSRGCPYRCVHCSSNPGREAGAPKRQRRLDAKALGRLVAHLAACGATRIAWLDELVNAEGAHFTTLLTQLAAAGVAYDFPNGMRADHVEPAHLRAMAGRIHTLSVSAESGVQRVVSEVVGKALDLRRLETTVAAAAGHRIPTLVHFIIGLPGESAEEIQQTLDFALRLRREHGAEPAVQFATPLPGTELARRTGPLRLVDDFGPHFQHQPLTAGDGWSAQDLRAWRGGLERRLAAERDGTTLVLNPTDRCNNQCGFCAVGNRTAADRDLGELRRALYQARRGGARRVELDGGEPTLHPGLLPLIRLARAWGYEHVGLTTNGRRCAYRDYAAALVASGLTALRFSVHGAGAAGHGREVGVAEAFEQTLAGIGHAVALAPPDLQLALCVTLTRGSVAELPAIAARARDLGLRRLELRGLTPFGPHSAADAPEPAAVAAAVGEVVARHPGELELRLIDVPACQLPGLEHLVAGDGARLAGRVVWAADLDRQLAAYVEAARQQRPLCRTCEHRLVCAGFVELAAAGELPNAHNERLLGPRRVG